jgi:hypothetical protein
MPPANYEPMIKAGGSSGAQPQKVPNRLVAGADVRTNAELSGCATPTSSVQKLRSFDAVKVSAMPPINRFIARALIGSLGFGLASFGYDVVQQAAAANATTKQQKRKVVRRRHLPSTILCPGDPRCPPIRPPG